MWNELKSYWMHGLVCATNGSYLSNCPVRLTVAFCMSLFAHVGALILIAHATPAADPRVAAYGMHSGGRLQGLLHAKEETALIEARDATQSPVSRDGEPRPDNATDYVPPTLIGNIDLDTDDIAPSTLRGQLLFKVFVDHYGTPRRVQVIQSSLPKDATGSILARFFNASYKPAEAGGKAVSGVATFKVVIDDDIE